MTRHLIDHPKSAGATARLKHFLRVEKAARPNGSTKELQRRQQRTTQTARTRAFLRIARES